MKTVAFLGSAVCLVVLAGCARSRFLAGADSLKFDVAIGGDEKRGELPATLPGQLKQEIAPLLEQLRDERIGLKSQTELNIESYFTVADAFEADGLLMQASDCLADLKGKLEDLVAARKGHKNPRSLIETEDDILHYRDAHSLHVIDGSYTAGAQPTERGYRWLKSKGITTVINLRLPSEYEKALVEHLGMTYVHIPWADEQPPTIEQVKRMLAAVKQAEGRVFQHCLRGIGRDMTMAGCYLIATSGAKAEAVIEQGKRLAPRWTSDQKRDSQTGQPVQFQLLRQFEQAWQSQEQESE